MLISHSYVSLPEDLHFDTHWAISSMELLYAKGILRQHLVHSFPCGLSVDTFPSTNQQSTHQQKSLLDHPCAINKICPCWTSSKMNEWTISWKNPMKTHKKKNIKSIWKLPKHLSKNVQKSEKPSKIRKISRKSGKKSHQAFTRLLAASTCGSPGRLGPRTASMASARKLRFTPQYIH